MPEESTIDLDEHTALVAYEVEQRTRESIGRMKQQVRASRAYVAEVRRFLDDVRAGLRRL